MLASAVWWTVVVLVCWTALSLICWATLRVVVWLVRKLVNRRGEQPEVVIYLRGNEHLMQRAGRVVRLTTAGGNQAFVAHQRGELGPHTSTGARDR